MSDLLYKNYLFSNSEFMVLSAMVGMEKIHIISENTSKQMDKAELNQIIFQLYQKEILQWNNNAYALKPEIGLLFREIKRAKKELQIYSEKSGSPLLCFWGNSAVITELSGNDREVIKVHGLQNRELFTELYDREILPDGNRQEIYDLFREENVGKGNILVSGYSKFLQNGSIDHEELQGLLQKYDELSAIITVYDRKSEKDQNIIFIMDYGICDAISYLKNGFVCTDYYTVDNLYRLLML